MDVSVIDNSNKESGICVDTDEFHEHMDADEKLRKINNPNRNTRVHHIVKKRIDSPEWMPIKYLCILDDVVVIAFKIFEVLVEGYVETGEESDNLWTVRPDTKDAIEDMREDDPNFKDICRVVMSKMPQIKDELSSKYSLS